VFILNVMLESKYTMLYLKIVFGFFGFLAKATAKL
jgi:hypothetical protein